MFQVWLEIHGEEGCYTTFSVLLNYRETFISEIGPLMWFCSDMESMERLKMRWPSPGRRRGGGFGTDREEPVWLKALFLCLRSVEDTNATHFVQESHLPTPWLLCPPPWHWCCGQCGDTIRHSSLICCWYCVSYLYVTVDRVVTHHFVTQTAVFDALYIVRRQNLHVQETAFIWSKQWWRDIITNHTAGGDLNLYPCLI